MKKLITLSTLTAGIGVSAFGLNIHHADAAELTQNQATQQVNQQKQHNNSEQQQNLNHQQNQNQLQKQGYNHQQTSQSNIAHQARQINHSNLNNQRYHFGQSNYNAQNQPTQHLNQQKQNQNVIHYNEAKSKKIVTNKQAPSHFTNTIYSNNHTNPNLHLASHTTEDVASATSTMNKLNSVSHTTSSSSSSTSNSSSVTSTSTKTTSSTKNNLYTAGQCTWYVYDKVNGALGSTWGNANNWANAAKAAGYTVNHHAKAGSILQTTAGSLGHVAYVESVNSDGSITISEMNYTGGAYVTDTRTISASEVSAYNYIHLS